MRSHEFPFAILVAAPLLLSGAASEANDLKAVIADMGGVTCPDMSDLTCVGLDVPIDHRATGGGTIKIEYAIHFATEQSKGVMFYVVGGPGESGIAEADPWLQFYDDNDDNDRLKKNMDVVFFDQRGVGRSNSVTLPNGVSQPNGLTCPNAQTRFEMAQPSVARPDEAIAIAKAYATDCPAELKSRALLNVLDTQQAIRDLELFRQAIGRPKVWMYGYSYGTQFAQQYATAFPDAVKGVIIDGVVDLTVPYDRYEETSVLAAEGILTRVLDACGAIACGTDMKGGNAGTVYKTLAARAAEKPIEIEFPLGDGTSETRQLTRNMLETATYEALYTPDYRAEFLRALAAASRDNLVPMLELSYSRMNVDPKTVKSLDDAAYYAITCSEYGEQTPDGDGTAWQIMEQAKAFSAEAPRLPEYFYMERLVCAFWPTPAPALRPQPYAGGDFPTLIINADADPITPLSMSQSVFAHARNASMIAIENGPHASWGYGDACVDEPVYDLLLSVKTPATMTSCTQPLIGEYTKLTLTDESSANDARAVAAAVEAELREAGNPGKGAPKETLTVGCDLGGTMTVSGDKDRKEYSFAGCTWWSGIVLDGTATRAGAKSSESLKLDLAISGQHSGKISYRRDAAAQTETWSGDYDGKDVSAP